MAGPRARAVPSAWVHQVPGGDPASAQDLAWGQLGGPNSTAFAGAGFAPDPLGEQAVLFGGVNGSSLSDSTEVYNESTNAWTLLTPSPRPSARADFAFASNVSGRFAVLFGGVVNETDLRPDNSTWVYSFSLRTWMNVSSGTAPPAREDAAFAIDPLSGAAFLFGGWNRDFGPTSTVTYNDLWKFDPTSHVWMPLESQGNVPPPLEGATFSWDPLIGTLLLYGGCYPCSSTIWSLDPTTATWTELAPAAGVVPAPRASGAWSWDPVQGSDVLFGGTDGQGSYNDTYEYLPATNTWVREAPLYAPSARSVPAYAWLNVSGNETLLLAGGYANPAVGPALWRLAPTANLSIEVQNASDDAVVSGARVDIGTVFEGTTNASGVLTLTDVNPIETALRVARLGYAVAERSFWLAPASVTYVNLSLTPVAPSDVSFHVVSNGTNVSLAGVSVNLTVDQQFLAPSPIATDALGWANYSGVPTESPAPIAVAVATSIENYTATQNFSLPSGSNIALTLNLTPFPRLEIEVTGFLANSTQVPVQNAEVTESGLPLGQTLPNGWLNTTSAFPGGPTHLSISAYGFATNASNVTLPYQGTFVDRFSLAGLPFGNMSVTVLDNDTHQPISGAVVEATGQSNRSTVATHVLQGTKHRLPAPLSVPAGYYLVRVTAYGYYPYLTSTAILVSPRALVLLVVNLTLLPGANVSVLVHDESTGLPLSNANVSLGGLGPNQTDAGGWINFTNVHFGLANVSVSASGYYNNTTTVALAPYQDIAEFLVNMTPVSPGGGGPSGSPLLGGLTAVPYLVVLLITVFGAITFLLLLRVETRRVDRRTEEPLVRPPRDEL